MTTPNSLEARDIAHLVHPYTDLRAHESRGPLVITEGRGIRVRDAEGHEYIEGLAGLWCVSLGFGEERLIEAARRQMERIAYTHTFAHRSSEPVIMLAEKLTALAPGAISRAFFVNSGSEAVDTAIKLAWYYNNARGLLLRPLPGDVVGICPPLIITESEIDELFDRLAGALDDTVGGLEAAA